jgi:cell division septation protein DedD
MTVKNRRVFELRLGKIGLIVFIGGMSLMLFSIFLLGIVVGKHMEAYPDRYSSGITDLIRDRLFAAASKQGKAAPTAAEQGKNHEPAGGGADFDLTFYDTLGGKKGGAATGAPAGPAKYKPSDISAEQTSPAGSAADAKPPMTIPAGTMSETTPPVSIDEGGTKKLNPSPEGTPAGEAGIGKPRAGEAELRGNGRFEVQVAAYREKSQAEQLVKKVTAFGFSPRVVMKELPGKGRWFRVIVGGFESRGTAQAAADQMAGKIRGLKFVIRSSNGNGND